MKHLRRFGRGLLAIGAIFLLFAGIAGLCVLFSESGNWGRAVVGTLFLGGLVYWIGWEDRE